MKYGINASPTTCDPAFYNNAGDFVSPERHVWRRSWRERLFGTMPLKKCECGRVCWMDRAEKRYRWTA